MTKKYIYLLIMIIILCLLKYNNTQYAFNNLSNKYTMEFKDCSLNINNFIEELSSIKYSTIEVIPYYNIKYYNSFNNIKFIYNTNDLNYIISDIKDKYLSIMIDNDSYITNICINKIIIDNDDYKII